MAKDKEQYQTIEGIQTHPCFGVLSPRQKEWFLELCRTNGDRMAATHKVYPSTQKTHTRHNYASEKISLLMHKPAIRTLIAAYFGDVVPLPMTRSEMALLISNRLRDPELSNAEFLRLSQTLIVLNSWQKDSDRVTKELNAPMRNKRKGMAAEVANAAEPKLEPAPESESNIDEVVLEIEKALKSQQG